MSGTTRPDDERPARAHGRWGPFGPQHWALREGLWSVGVPDASGEPQNPLASRTHRVMRVVGPTMGVVWAVFLLQPWQSAWDSPPGPARVVSLVAIALLSLTFVWVVLTHAGPRGERMATGRAFAFLGGQLALVALACVAAEQDGLVGLVFVSVSAVFLLRDLRALAVALGMVVLAMVVPRVVAGWETIDDLVLSIVLATVAVFGFTQLVQRNRQLQLARDEVAVLAVERERERIARDMHDILGHSLTVISVKAELAARMFDVDGERARAEMLEVQQLARSALADVRGMVTATRAVTLAGELAGARQAFDAAGIEAEVPGAVDDVPDDLRVLFAWAVREGTTNVLRHSGATCVRVGITADTLTVDDDGAGPVDGRPGNGLHGLAERARRSGARVEATRGPLGGYRLLVTTQGSTAR
ncbi:sensor histidine kinase [Cellulomonas sp. H30R-01]|uniref:sensor histidine kinase n=1 Tax=Cellulomonas sp. H30R-01 TaxID=2704467 RepID=UPI00138C71BE|nr:sensor histidine kinase [Cellulomonas sp. H30R-01]QHT56117.1 sensor histidine kinase [Cellulomonas sp. H30R-01]